MKRVTRTLCAILAVLFCLQIVPSREIVKEINAETAYVYDPDAAVAWAKNGSNFIDGDYLCAAFVSYCLQHGGLTDVFFGTPCTLTSYVEQMHYGKKVPLTDENIAKMKPGDFIVVFCDLHEGYYGIHTIFVTEVNHEEGYLRYSAKNDYKCNEYMSFEHLKRYSSYFTCLHHGDASVINTYIVSMYTGQNNSMYTDQNNTVYTPQNNEDSRNTIDVNSVEPVHVHVYDNEGRCINPDCVAVAKADIDNIAEPSDDIAVPSADTVDASTDINKVMPSAVENIENPKPSFMGVCRTAATYITTRMFEALILKKMM